MQLYETGIQSFGGQLYSIWNEKLDAISLFLEGFWGHLVPQYMGEKYYDMDFFRRVYLERIEEYCRYSIHVYLI